MVADAGVQAVGLNFFDGSKRYVSPSSAVQIVQGLPTGVKRVGVFVNAPIDEIREIAGLVKLDFVQLHGDEPPEFLAELADLLTSVIEGGIILSKALNDWLDQL